MPEALTYRLFEERDLPSLLRLWEEAGWGTLTEEQWREWYVETPHGACLITVAVDGRDEVVAQEMFTPSVVCVGEKEVRALRFSAPILRQELQGESLRSGDHPMINLYKTAAEAAAQQGFSVVYSLPERGWLSIFRLAPRFGVPPFTESDYACVSLPIEAKQGGVDNSIRALADGVAARPVAEFGKEYDELWLAAKKSFPIHCGVVRQRDWLRFRNGGRIAVEVRDSLDNSLVGYTATAKKNGVLADILARHPRDLERVLAATLVWFGEERGRSVPEAMTHLKVMRTPVLALVLENFNGETLDYKFAFTCNTFDPSLPLEAIAPERWHVMPGD
ncbi:MAG: hypothetical protein WKF74_10515 [Pyrinomonadaceae bacterium]